MGSRAIPRGEKLSCYATILSATTISKKICNKPHLQILYQASTVQRVKSLARKIQSYRFHHSTETVVRQCRQGLANNGDKEKYVQLPDINTGFVNKTSWKGLSTLIVKSTNLENDVTLIKDRINFIRRNTVWKLIVNKSLRKQMEEERSSEASSFIN
ncbi:AIF_collapsed_G0031980.mRNA.1.CDS.1 [Saccharomyces cerevisiae]|nr:AIF_collapsed_G0031980.mRNA.1.CDS.1 [Saccharomyces cerevisiae]